MIPYGKQDISQDDIDAVIDVLRSDFLTQGPKVPLFEKSLLDYAGANHAVAVNSATSALHIACLALGLGEGDWLWTSPISYVASANCGLYCGAQVDFVDIDYRTYNLCPIELEKKLNQAKKDGKLPKVLVVVHMAGQPCDLKTIAALAKQYGVFVIEDASHAIGGRYFDDPIGNCRYSDITVFSFHPVKIVTTGEGGAALTNCERLAQKMSLYRSHGVTRDQSLMTEPSHGGWYYQQVLLGYNYRMTEMQAALGVSQMTRLDEFVSARHKIAERYNLLFSGLPVKTPYQKENTYSGMHLYVIRLQLDRISKSHKEVFQYLRNEGIGVNLHYIPIHSQPYFQNMGFKWGDFPVSESYYSEAISIPMYPALSELEQIKIVSLLKILFKNS